MPTVRFQGFNGAFPRVDKRLLPEPAAQSAENVLLTAGRLDPMGIPLSAATTRSGTVQSVYRMYSGSTDYWLNWTSDVDIVRSPVAGDTGFRAYFTSSAFEPRATNLALATGGTPYPNSWYVLGVNPPSTAASVAAVGGAASDVTRTYVYTYVTAWGEESAPSPASSEVTGKTDATWTISSMQVAPLNTYTVSGAAWSGGTLTVTVNSTFGLRAGEYVTLAGLAPAALNASWEVASVVNTTSFTITMADPGVITDQVGTAARDAPHNTTSMVKRIYRSVTDTAGNTDYYYVGEVAVATTSFVDSTAVVGEPLPTTGWAMPPTDLQGLRTLPSGALCGFSGNTFCMSEPYYPYAWPVAYQLSSDYPIVGIGVFGASAVVCTSGQPYIAAGVDPASTTLVKLDQNWPCLAKRGIAEFSGTVYYPTTLGLAAVNASGATIATEAFYAQADWEALEPANFIAASYDNAYYTAVETDISRYILVISPKYGVSTITLQVDELYTDPGNGLLYAVYDNEIWELNGDIGDRMTMSWTSREVMLPGFVNFGAARIYADFDLSATESAAIDTYNDAAIAANVLLLASGLTLGAVNSVAVNASHEVNGSVLEDLNTSSPAVTFNLYADGEHFHTKVVTSSAIFRLPGGKKYDNFYVNLSANIPVRSVVIGDTPQTLKLI